MNLSRFRSAQASRRSWERLWLSNSNTYSSCGETALREGNPPAGDCEPEGHRVRDGTLARGNFIESADQIREQVKALLQEAADYEIGDQEKTPLAKTVRTCRQLLKVEPAMWLFITVEGVEPTNNAAERAIRPAVLWRRTSFGTQSQAGSHFVARMLTVVTTLRSQQRNVLEYMTAAIRAARATANPSPLCSLK